MAKVGFIGLGIMGAPMAANLQQGGHQLFVHDRNPVPVGLIEKGATLCESGNAVGLAGEKIGGRLRAWSPRSLAPWAPKRGGPADTMKDGRLMEGLGKQAHDRIHFLTACPKSHCVQRPRSCPSSGKRETVVEQR